MLRQVNAPLIGAVLNGVTEESGYGGYSSRYYTAENVSNGASGNGNGRGGKASRSGRLKTKRSG
jgi:hypothetical protein